MNVNPWRKVEGQRKVMSTGIRFDDNVVCDTCGRFGAYDFDGDRLCATCYENRGSCCPEFGADDLWPAEETEGPRPGCRKDNRGEMDGQSRP